MRLIFFVFMLLFFTACNEKRRDINWDAEFDKAGVVGSAYRSFGNESCIGKCQWSRVSSTTLSLNGTIGKGTFDEFDRKLDHGINEVWLNSAGGNVREALKIANVIQDRKLKIVVNGFCISSCANYLFLAGFEKKINGIVGFHGSVQAMGGKEAPCHATDDPRCISGNETAENEQVLFRSVGINTLLFDVTQSIDKGMKNGKLVAYYAPSVKTLNALGVKGIDGDQSEHYLQVMQYFYKISGEPEFAIATDPNPTILDGLRKLQ
ncbi:hypothetical protein [Undibacterium sp. Di24W]|uniref:hypothetical protein n=1 Tax=Undibacterium sp. Di24W TaxID=3413033 RepID=UPI003BF062DE